jgi:hypothetical protein
LSTMSNTHFFGCCTLVSILLSTVWISSWFASEWWSQFIFWYDSGVFSVLTFWNFRMSFYLFTRRVDLLCGFWAVRVSSLPFNYFRIFIW